MKIDPSAPPRAPSVRRARGGKSAASSGTFDSHLAEGARGSDALSSAPPPAGMNALLAVQEVADISVDADRARAQGEAILDRLDDLRHGLLMGFVSKEKLQELTNLVRVGRIQVKDKNLTEILDQIELRAEVELAKLASKA